MVENNVIETAGSAEDLAVQRKKGISQVGIRYGIFGGVVCALELILPLCLRTFVPEFLEKNQILLSFLMTILVIYVIGFPMVCLLNKKLPAEKLEQNPLGIGKFLLGLLFVPGLVAAGTLIGVPLHFGFSLLVGSDPTSNSAVVTLMMNSDPFMRILTVGILAPIFEELIFRKVMVDHLVKYGKWVAVAASGLTFGFFHGNFSQCFFAAGLGFFFAYVYIKTGRVRYTIAYHMAVNLTTSVLTMAVMGKYLDAVNAVGMDNVTSGSVDAAMQVLPATLLFLGWMGFLALLGLIGFILLCVNLKKFRFPGEELSFGKALKTVVANPGMWVFFAACVFMFARTYLL